MKFEELKEIITQTRCTRRFDSNYKIDTKDLVEIVDIVRQISSAMNAQPLKYIIVNDKKYFDIIHKPIRWASHLTNWNQSEDEKPSAYILILNDKTVNSFAMVDAGISLQTILLALSTKGLSGCALASIDKEAYKKELSLPEDIEPFLAIAVGKKAEDIKLVDAKEDTNYYRDEKDTHCVPKRVLEDVLLRVYE